MGGHGLPNMGRAWVAKYGGTVAREPGACRIWQVRLSPRRKGKGSWGSTHPNMATTAQRGQKAAPPNAAVHSACGVWCVRAPVGYGV
eukprot:6077613-Prymnesium_polylepis.1